MSEHRKGEQVFIGGIGTGDSQCPKCNEWFPCDGFKRTQLIAQLREKVEGLISKCRLDDSLTSEFSETKITGFRQVLSLLDEMEK